MAFPTSPSNNQVHKEGNRAFVYDSALGVWDHVREADRGVSETLNLTSDVQFPSGKVNNVFRFYDDFFWTGNSQWNNNSKSSI